MKQMSRKSWLATFKRLANTLSDVLERGEDINKAYELLVKHCSRLPPPGQQQGIPPIDGRIMKPTEDPNVDGDDIELEDVDWELGETEDDCQIKEPSRGHLKALGSVLISTLESSEELSRNLIHQKAFQGTKFTDEEVDTVIKLANVLRPFVPKKDSDNDMVAHVALRAPIAVIANSVLRTTGYSKFTRRISPSMSASALHSLGLNAVGLYESLCSKGTDQFDVKDSRGNPLSDVAKVTTDDNKKAIFEAFFDLELVLRVCIEYGLDFQYRVTYVNKYTVHVLGAVVPNGGFLHNGRMRIGHPAVSQIEARKKNKGGGQAKRWTVEFFSQDLNGRQVKQKAEQLSAQVEDLQKTIQGPRKKLKGLQQVQSLLRRAANRIKVPDRFQSDEYQQLRTQRAKVRQARVELNAKEAELRETRNQLYYYNKLDKADKSSRISTTSQVSVTAPTWDHYTMEDDTRHLDISRLLADQDKEVVFSGTDYGLRKMSETVPVTKRQLNEHLNYYSVLSGLEGDGTPQSSSSASSHQVSRVPRSHTITAKQVNEISHSKKAAKRRERRMKTPILGQEETQEQIRTSLQAISDPSSSISRAVSIQDIDTAHKCRKEHREVLREFEHTNARSKDLQTQRLRTNKTWNKLGASERHHVVEASREHAESASSRLTVSPADGYCSMCHIHHIPNAFDQDFRYNTQCPHSAKEALPVMLVGNAGTCVGSRIGGHARRGGKKLRKEHQQHCVVAIQDEYRTSKVCIYCFQEVRPARSRRIIQGKEKMVRVHGALECSNPNCPAFREGYTIRPRDAHAAVAIALAGVSALKHPQRKPLQPFSRVPTGRNTNTRSPGLVAQSSSRDRTDPTGAPVQETGI
ncbi:hypothetical protein B0O80DRAFT_24618 [Mortierella sp. GBAus27b]|nr:hypothetical protein B0O80DRAFT_24618 [Mortierella sp. GBAus27b]